MTTPSARRRNGTEVRATPPEPLPSTAAPVAQSIFRLREQLLDEAFSKARVRSAIPTEKGREEVRRRVEEQFPSWIATIARTTTRARSDYEEEKKRAAQIIRDTRAASWRRGRLAVRVVTLASGLTGLLLWLYVALSQMRPFQGHAGTLTYVVVVIFVTIMVYAVVLPSGRSRHPLIRGGDRVGPTRLSLHISVAVVVIATIVILGNWPGAERRSWPIMLVASGAVMVAAAAYGVGVSLAPKAQRAELSRWESDLIEHWPRADSWSEEQVRARKRAEQAHREWFDALVTQTIFLFIGKELERREHSYETWLEPRPGMTLAEIEEVAQFVPTRASEQLHRILNSTVTASIGISGPRGVGKSALLSSVGDPQFSTARLGLSVLVAAPTNYDSREFLTDLFAQLCHKVLDEVEGTQLRDFRSSGRVVARRYWPLTLSLAGLLSAVIAVFWPSWHEAAGWIAENLRWIVVSVGLGAALVGAVGQAQRSSRSTPIERPLIAEAREHLRVLRYLRTHTAEWSGNLKAPVVADISRKDAVQEAERVRTYPELVRDFRAFVEQVGRDRRADTDTAAKTVICIDELDKIGSAEEAEGFLNNIKAIFGIRYCQFLVSISEDALSSFERRALTVRTAFDSSFDMVLSVPRLRLADARHLLERRLIVIPDPFVALCHCLAGGLPRDLIRVTRHLLDTLELIVEELREEQAARERADPDKRLALQGILRVPLAEIASRLIEDDFEAVTAGQLASLSRLRCSASDTALTWVGNASQKPLRVTTLLENGAAGPNLLIPAPPMADPSKVEDVESARLVHQYRAYLCYTATLLEVFCDDVERLAEAMEKGEAPLDLLADARAQLAMDYMKSRRLVDEFRVCWGIPKIEWTDGSGGGSRGSRLRR